MYFCFLQFATLDCLVVIFVGVSHWQPFDPLLTVDLDSLGSRLFVSLYGLLKEVL